MNFVKRLLIAVISLISFSCTTDDTVQPEQLNDLSYRISSKNYYFADKTFNKINFFYNDANQLIKKEEHNTKGEIIFYENYVYSKGKLLRIERGTDKSRFGELRYSYKDDKIKVIEYWLAGADSVLKKSHQIEYEYQNELLAKSRTTFTNGSAPFYTLYTYIHGNVASIKAFDQASNQLLEENVFFYDDKKNPFYNTSNEYLGQPVASSKNNVIFSRIISSKHVPVNTDLLFEFQYNDKGYPVEKYLKGKDGKRYIEESYTYTY